ncbi:IS66 family transposase [Granulosicoccus sp. 3-233]|uniref:IS66 family transposase n=1 Tax=Granulosicoccus sp. 3-233 TaxID=3417969 RepID=UPI003D32A8E0
MSQSLEKPDFTRFAASGLPTPDALMAALLEQQKMLSEKDELLAESQSRLQNQKARIAVLEERLRLMQERQFGSKSEKNLLQEDWLADDAETLADGEPDTDDGEIEEDEPNNTQSEKKPRKRAGRKGLSADLPRIQRFICLTDEEREGAVRTFFVRVKEELDIIPARV